jgi:hypothetical protein
MRWPGMSPDHHEVRYLVTQDKALRLRDYIPSHMDLDERSVGKSDLSYPVHTLYLDSKDLRLYEALATRHRNSTQLRLRFYATSDHTPVFVEIKRWAGIHITKERARVNPQCVPSLLRGTFPAPADFLEPTARANTAVENFIRLVDELAAAPLVHISFLREGYADVGGHARINLDREIRVERRSELQISPAQPNARHCFEPMVMLELKFIERFPSWFLPLVEDFNLEEFDTSKYIVAMQTVGLAPP